MLVLILVQAATAVPQVAPRPQSVGIAQVSSGASSDTGVAQVGGAAAPARSVRVAPVAGQDRCDDPAHAADRVCRAPLEAKAQRFAPRDPNPLSREQRAVAERRVVDPRSDMPAAERRIARGDLDPDTPAAQGVAAAAASRAPPGNDPADTGLTDLQRAIRSGVIVPDDVAPAVDGSR